MIGYLAWIYKFFFRYSHLWVWDDTLTAIFIVTDSTISLIIFLFINHGWIQTQAVLDSLWSKLKRYLCSFVSSETLKSANSIFKKKHNSLLRKLKECTCTENLCCSSYQSYIWHLFDFYFRITGFAEWHKATCFHWYKLYWILLLEVREVFSRPAGKWATRFSVLHWFHRNLLKIILFNLPRLYKGNLKQTNIF